MTVDIVLLTAEIAAKAFSEGRLTEMQARRQIEKCINVVSIENGYVMPFPDTKFDNSDSDDKGAK